MADMPTVTRGRLFLDGSEQYLELDTPAWLVWLRKQAAFVYQDEVGHFTARRERRPGGSYWYAYRRVNGKLQKRYLGKDEALSAQHLHVIAARLSGADEKTELQPEAADVLRTRFSPPRPGVAWVARTRLLSRFQQAIVHPLTLISAPAGSGKTTLLSLACAQQNIRRVAWLTLENAERDPTRFWHAVLSALELAVPGLTREARARTQTALFPASEALLTTLIATLAACRVPLLLVLDDYHLASAEVDEGLCFLVEHMPETTRLVVSSRQEPALPLVRWRVQGRLAEIRQDELRFSEDEADAFLRQTMRLELNSRQVAQLEQRTEGWIAGLQLAALSLVHQPDVDTFLSHFTGDNRYISDYVLREVLSGQEPAVQEFLTRTAILERFCGELCDAVTGRDDGQALLERIEQANLFLVSLDQTRRWYRYHPLFAEALRERQARQQPDLLREDHARAARWFATQGAGQSAIQHALAAEDYPLARTLMGPELESMLRRGEMATVLMWFHAIPLAEVETSPHLLLLMLLALLMAGEITPATDLLMAQESRLAACGLSPVLRGELATVQAFADMRAGKLSQATQRIQAAMSDLSAEAGVIYDLACLLYGATVPLFAQNIAQSLHMMTSTARSSLRSGNYQIASFALENRVHKELSQGRLRQAERTCQEILRINQNRQPSSAYLADLHLGEIYSEWNQLEQARESLERGLAVGSSFKQPEILVDGYIALARLHHLRGDQAAVNTNLDELEYFVLTDQVAPHTAWQIEACRARLQCARGNLAEATRWAQDYEETRRRADQQIPPALTDFSDFTLARIWLASGQYDAARCLLHDLLTGAQATDRGRSCLEACLLLALLEQTQGQSVQACGFLTRALELAAPEGFVRLFLDEGPAMNELLSCYLNRAAQATTLRQRTALAHARLLLRQTRSDSTAAPLPERLSTREMEILQRLAAGRANSAIADELCLALSTVKWHILHLYRKLDVQTRLQAVARARALHLLAE